MIGGRDDLAAVDDLVAEIALSRRARERSLAEAPRLALRASVHAPALACAATTAPELSNDVESEYHPGRALS